MHQNFHDMLLWIAILWPLLLTLPVMHRHLPACRQLALVPALMLVLWPGPATMELPRLLFGVGLQLQDGGRWLLATVVLVWLLFAQRQNSETGDRTAGASTLFFMLTLAGHLGALLAADLVAFFVFSTLMGYGFYGLMMQVREPPVEAGRLYLIALVVADLALFEALLLAVFMLDDVSFGALREAIGRGESSSLYVWMVMLGCMLRAGFWPFHVWQWRLFSSLPTFHLPLLVAVPMATAWLGLLRGLPLGEAAFPVTGQVLQMTAVLAWLFILAGFISNRSPVFLVNRVSVALGAGLLLLLGRALAQPDAMGTYVHAGDELIALLVLILIGLGVVMARRVSVGASGPSASHLSSRYTPWLDRGLQRMHRVLLRMDRVPEKGRDVIHNVYLGLIQWQPRRLPSPGWTKALILFVFLMLLLAWLSSDF